MVRLSLMKFSKMPVAWRESVRQRWVDSLRIYCKGGPGGNGLDRYQGVGGQGGDAVFEVVESLRKIPKKIGRKRRADKDEITVRSLYDVFKGQFDGDSRKQRLIGGKGEHSHKLKIIGASGTPSVIKIPTGVTVLDDGGKVLAEMDEVGKRFTAAVGGAGGGPTNEYMGQPGEARFVRLDLKLIADLGLVGFPNAGKSTLLKAISNAKPKIASYPFTTIKPNLGELKFPDERVMTMADLPGLIEGAHCNIGMGYKFLKHVERTKMLVFVIDINGFQLNPASNKRSALDTILLLNKELEIYNPDLLLKPAVCLVNKMDGDGAKEKFLEVKEAFESGEATRHLSSLGEDLIPEKMVRFQEMIPMSAKFSRKSVVHVKNKIRAVMDNNADVIEDASKVVKEVEAEVEKMITDIAPKVY